MKTVIYQTISIILVLLAIAAPARADVAVLVGITGDSVTLHRVERSESIETVEQDLSDAIIKRRSLSPVGSIKLDTVDKLLLETVDKLLIEWFDASGALVHRESRSDPRFLHAPNGEYVVLPEATVLIRAPSDAVTMRIRPRGFAVFTSFNV